MFKKKPQQQHLAISQVCDIFPFQAQAKTQNEITDLMVLVQASIVLLLNIQDLAAQRQDGLEASIPSLFCTATCISGMD